MVDSKQCVYLVDASIYIFRAYYSVPDTLTNADGQLIIVGEDGRIGSRRLDLWGSDLVTTMLSPSWHAANVTKLNCLVANIDYQERSFGFLSGMQVQRCDGGCLKV